MRSRRRGLLAFGKPRCRQMVSRGEWQPEFRKDLCSERNIRFQFPGEGARPCMLGRRSGVALRISKRFRYDGRFAHQAILDGPQYCLRSKLNRGGFSPYRMVFVFNPADLYSWQDNDKARNFVRNAAISSQ